jgi:DNA-binding NarL/FixJ family response regulator
MLDQSVSRRIRSVVAQLNDGERVPVAEVVALSATGVDVTIDRAGEPAIVLVQPRRSTAFGALSARELEVAELIAGGLRNLDIAERLFISLATVKDHVHAVLIKTGLASRAGVIAAWHGRHAG